MKRTLILTIALTIALFTWAKKDNKSAFSAPSNLADSVNYALGQLNGEAIRTNVLNADTADTKKLKIFLDAFQKAFYPKNHAEELTLKGMVLGHEIAVYGNNLFGIDSLTANKDLIIEYTLRAIKGEKWDLSIVECNARAQAYLYGISRDATPQGAELDTLNMAFGYANGFGARDFFLRGDTTENDIALFIKGYNKGIKTPLADSLLFNALGTAINIKQHINATPFLLNNEQLPVDNNLFYAGLIDGISASAQKLFAQGDAENYLNGVAQKLEAQANEQLIKEQTDYLMENALRKEVSTTASGLQYEVLVDAEGPKPSENSTVKVHYTGYLIDGTKFDSSVDRGEPAEFPLNRVIKGWTEGVQLMSVGAKYRFFVPYPLAYGERGAGNIIPPYATLIFEIELLEIK